MQLTTKQLVAFRRAFNKEYGEKLTMSDDGIHEIIGPIEGDHKNVVQALTAVAAFVARNKMVDDAAEEAADLADTREALDAAMEYGTDQTPIRVRDFVFAIDASEPLLAHLEEKAEADIRRKVVDLETMDWLRRAYTAEKMDLLPVPNTIGPGVKRKGKSVALINRPAVIMVPGEKRARPEDFYIEAVRATQVGRSIESAISRIEKSVTKKDELTLNQKADINTLKTKLASRIQTVKKAVLCHHQFDALDELSDHVALERRFVKSKDGALILDANGEPQWERTTYPITIGKLPLSLSSQEKRNLSTNDFARINLDRARQMVNAGTFKHIYDAIVETLKRQQQEGVMKVTEKNALNVLYGFNAFMRTEDGVSVMQNFAQAKAPDERRKFRVLINTVARNIATLQGMMKLAEEFTKSAEQIEAEANTEAA